MEYSALVDVYDRLAGTASNNEKRDDLAAADADTVARVASRYDSQ